ncbi:MAG: adenylyl-sulfate kinase [Desulfovibrio sp.]|nr:adenylyl-sulfate kinase [Desulfovibrio sp.]
MKPVIWLLGLSGSGKTTLGSLLRLFLEGQGIDTELVDGDRFRREFGITGFTPADRIRNINAIRGHVLDLQAEGKACIVAAITPYESMRAQNRAMVPHYREVWVRCSLQTLAQRDTKGLYAKAAHGGVEHLTGVSDVFDEPRHADCLIDTDRYEIGDCYEQLRNLTLNALEEGHAWRQSMGRMLPTVPIPCLRTAAIAL